MTTDVTENSAHGILDLKNTDCCIVGGGPAGAVLALLLARQGICVILLEAHKDFDRDFRGDTIHPSVMEIMEELQLSNPLLQLPHSKIDCLRIRTPENAFTLADFSHLKTRYPYITMMPQVRFLEFITQEAEKYPNFHLIMGANVQELIEENGIIQGVRYRGGGGWHEVRATLTIGADGRYSRLRQQAGFELIQTSPPMDVIWFRLPRQPGDPGGGIGNLAQGRILVMLDRGDQWQLAYVIPKGGYQQIRAAGVEEFKKSVVEIVPTLSDGIESLQDWSQIFLLSVESSRVKRWYCPGLLLIGDAAHVMSPVGGVGINYAIQDAVVAANILTRPLKNKCVELADLAKVQSQRELPTRIIQAFQSFIQKRILAEILESRQSFQPPVWLRLPILRDLPARLIGMGIVPVHVQT
ncbi:FAD-dependent oxidoreductase [Umezakia ovalisporum]|jgi:2-polyprenyl-6-methoxyphenol hydroxylase-like FAD-dependent oxidoreductase|uniref:FAD-dependent oxidoreductase n=1 Tax=Umezakia ovalisporum FSS-62 TaxID=2971776 RepID=A0AA43GVW1_9CYAN|nr:FAD-dependent oxidoreductase [Umezakia ovalisporum]MDH6062601.1 FAD-dependent oxidoreductase [Umezakia ovalisporum FSS-62]MDH6079341.1 FAD-dependent oxidoreductase [Umezakia ovalisporum FSS-45]MDH6084095.1 FAD-dependent oxidoreductase [Umezakia ovalisporum TAC611]MDH6090094.1 FAD-dependent oxidoreductase [Umezakia ovalisporum Ak1311]CEJ43184.1 Monooxygenase, FAD-binding [Umezakia ovalisporum]